MERGGSGKADDEALDQLRFVFNLCDDDQDGVISVDEFRRIGYDHFDKTKPMELLIQLIDPEGNGCITFNMFRAGIETFLTTRSVRSRSTSQGSSSIDGPHSPTELSSLSEETFSNDSIHPLYPTSHSIVVPNGYNSTGSSPGCEIVSNSLTGEGEADTKTPMHSSPVPLRRQSMPGPSSVRDSPSLLGRTLLTRHSQLTIPASPSSVSKCSTPVELEADEMVSQLSDQLLDLSSKLENLEEDHKNSHGAREKLRRQKEELQDRMEEYEEQIRSTEELSQRLLQDNAERHAVSINRLRRESQAQLDDVTSQLQACREEVARLQTSESNLKTQLTTANERLEELDGCVCMLEEKKRVKEDEIQRVRERLRVEITERKKVRETHTQAVHEYEGQIRHWQKMCEEVRREKKRRSLTVSDMDKEVSKLKKEVERLKKDNEQLQARFLQHGKDLISQKVQSLADEMEDASKDKVMKVLRDTELHNARLHEYIEGLLVSIIDKHPELLEKR